MHIFRANGDSERANQALREALTENVYVPAYLTGQKRIPTRLPQTMSFGDEQCDTAYRF